MGWGARLRALRMDVGPFREHRDFRLLLIAGTVFYLGGMMTYVAIPFQVYQLTHSNLAVGAIGLVELVPRSSSASTAAPWPTTPTAGSC